MSVVDRFSKVIQCEEIAESRKILGHFMLTRKADHKHRNVGIDVDKSAHELKVVSGVDLVFTRYERRAFLDIPISVRAHSPLIYNDLFIGKTLGVNNFKVFLVVVDLQVVQIS